jgi:LmbE family N-acetylglucosaminyl deacetylase
MICYYIPSTGGKSLRTIQTILLLALTAPLCVAQGSREILVVTADSADYIWAAGGTLASFIQKGYTVDVAQFGNDEKLSSGLPPAQTRLANIEEARQAAKLLGVHDVVYMAHKSGETGQIASTEMRSQLFTLIRGLRPRMIFIPDPYIHYQQDRDWFYVGKMAEEAWGYSGGSTFANELERMGLHPYGAPEVYYYAARPYRRHEGGEGNAKLLAVDIGSTFDLKCLALDLLLTHNRLQAAQTVKRLDDLSVSNLARSYAEELAETIGKKHGLRYAEEFNYVNMRAGGGLPPHIREHAVAK